MAAGNFPRCQREVFAHEGGYTNNPKDPGNWTGGKVGVGALKGTKYGIAANSYPNEDIKNLTKERAYALYKRDYWDKFGGDQVAVGLDLAAYDLAVNSGVGRVRQLYPKAYAAASTSVGRIKALCAARLAFMRSLRTWATFGKGWQRRVAHVEATGVKWALEADGKPPAEVKAELAKESRTAATQAKKETGKAAAPAAAAGATTQAPAEVVAQIDWTNLKVGLAILAVVIVGAVVTLIFINRARAHRARAAAFAEVAAKG